MKQENERPSGHLGGTLRNTASQGGRTETFGGIDGFALKVAAIVGMTCNHVANVFAVQLPTPLLLALYSLGGLTFPIMAFLLVEGFRHTSSLSKYALRLFLFALVAQVPYSLLWGAVPNVLFTLLAGLAVLWAREKLGDGPPSIAVLCAATVLTISFDWGGIGVLLVFLFQVMREREAPNGIWLAMLVPYASVGLPALLNLPNAVMNTQAASFGQNTLADAGFSVEVWGTCGYAFAGFTLASFLLTCYNGCRGRSMKWFFYAYYPAHLLAIWLVKLLAFT